MRFRRPVVVRRGMGLLGAAAVGAGAYTVGRAAANRAAQDREQDAQVDEVPAQQATAAPPAPAAAPATSEERIAQLQELGKLKASGVLTDEEFQREKQRILAGG